MGTNRNRRSARTTHGVPRGSTSSTHAPPVTPPEIALSGQAISRTRVYCGPSPRGMMGTYSLMPLCYTSGDQAAADQARQDAEWRRNLGIGGPLGTPGLAYAEPEDTSTPLFSRDSVGNRYTTVGLVGLRGKLERRESGGGWTLVRSFTTEDAGRFQLDASLQLRKHYKLTLVLDPLPDGLVATEVEHQRTVPAPPDAGTFPFRRGEATTLQDPDRLRYKRETVVVEFTMPSALPTALPPNTPMSFVEMRAKHYLYDANDDEIRRRGHPELAPDHDLGDHYEDETWQAVFHGVRGSEGPWLDLWDLYAVAFGTFVLKVDWRSQRRRDPMFPPPQNPVHAYWIFSHPENGHMKTRDVPGVHLCGAACEAMVLGYFGYRVDAQDVAVAAARYFADGVYTPDMTERALWPNAAYMWPDRGSTVIAGSPAAPPPPPGGFDSALVFPGADGTPVVGIWPHMKDCGFYAALEVLADVPTAERRWFVGAGNAPSMEPSAAGDAIRRIPAWSEPNARTPKIDRREHRAPPAASDRRSTSLWKHWEPSGAQPITDVNQTIMGRSSGAQFFLSLGYPPTVYEDLPGSVEHGRVCFGLVVKADGTVHQAYTHNPNHVEEVYPDRHKLVASKGYHVMAHELSTEEIVARVANGSFGADLERVRFIR